ncbi:unnamed protein product [Pieris brassicae]|uniref:Uncharacterized protein n=1 Tax=Pieris brassicae TaxID=7116 RepID=A0A9P0SW51_PIEBR|nr:unnamed protein product [Pieris brassicae]
MQTLSINIIPNFKIYTHFAASCVRIASPFPDPLIIYYSFTRRLYFGRDGVAARPFACVVVYCVVGATLSQGSRLADSGNARPQSG